MTYQVAANEIAINYLNTTYVVTLTPSSDPSSFRVKSPIDGSLETVDADTAAHLFGAEIAVTTLQRLYGQAQLSQIQNDWANVLAADSTVVGLSAVNNAAGSFSGLLLGSLFTAGAGTLLTSANAAASFASLTEGMAPSVVELAFVSAAVLDATYLLNQATGEYNAIQGSLNSNRNVAISYDAIKQAIDNSLVSFATGTAASQAAGNIPVVNQSIWDDVFDFLGSLAGALTDGITKVKGLLSTAGVTLLGNTSDAADLIGKASDISDLKDYIASVSSVLAASDSAKFPQLTDSGLVQAANALKGTASVTASSHVPSYSISPNPASVNENAGTLTFTVTRTDTSQLATVYVSTVYDQGTSNSNNLYYDGILNKPVTFTAGASTATVQLTIHDLGLTSSAEAFRLIVQKNSGESPSVSLATETFTIVNSDPPPASSYTITPAAPSFDEKSGIVTFTITRTNFTQAATVYASTVHDQGTDNPGGNRFYDGLLNQRVTFAAGASTATVQLKINDPGLTSGSENFRLIVQQHSTDPATTFLATDTFTIHNNDAGIIANASINEPVNTTFQLSPFLSVPAPPSGKTISLVNFINTHTGPGQLTNGGTPTSGNIAVAYSAVGQVGFATGSITGSDKIEMYATYSDGTVSNTVDLTVNIQPSSTPIPSPQTSSGPVVSSGLQALQVTIGQTGILSSSNLNATDTAYPDPSQLTYTITNASAPGSILVNGQIAHSFTQADVNAGHVVFQTIPSPGVTSEQVGQFTYTVSDPSFRQSASTTETVKVEPAPAPPSSNQPFIDINSFQPVQEGGQIFVLGNRFTTENLHVTDTNPSIPAIYTGSSKDAIIVYTVVNQPTHGNLVWATNYPSLWLPGQQPYYGQQVTQFTQNDLNNGWFTYQNDFLSGAADSFTFTVSDGFGGTIGLTTAKIPIVPIDTLRLDINAGAFVTPGGQSIISPDWLRVEDGAPNAYPNGYPVFTLVQAPQHGTLLVNGQPASTFTQLDIYNEKVVYKQNGDSASSDQFALGVLNDAQGNSIANLVVPVTIAANALNHNTGGVVSVGQSLTIDGSKLHVAAPGLGSGNVYSDPASAFVYKVTAAPQHGTLTANGTSLGLNDQFTQDQLDSGLVVYTEDGSSAASDSFNFSISDIFVHNNFGSDTFNISIANTNGGRIFSGATSSDMFFSGPGNNFVSGGTSTTVDYALAPAGVIVDLKNGQATNGFGGIDTLVNVHGVIGSSFADTIFSGPGTNLLQGGGGDDKIIGTGGNDTAGFSGTRSDYLVVSENAVEVQIIDLRSGSPDGTDDVSNVQSFKFSDGTFTFAQLGAITEIEQFGVTALGTVGNNYFLYANGTASGPELQYQGSPVTTFSGWSPIAGEQTATGYEVAWHNSNGAFTVWNVDGNGNFVSDTVGSLAANSASLEALETSFHQDLNGDGTIGLPGTIESFGSTSLVQTGSDYFLDANGTASGPELQYQGSPVTTFSGWSPIAGEQTATGYEVAWHNSNGAFTVWNVDGNGNFVSDTVGSLAANSTSLEALETSFHQDLNGDGTIGLPGTIESFGSTSLVQTGSDYFLDANGTASGPELQYQGSPVTTFSGWSPIAGEQTATGYEVAWHNSNGAFTVWNVDGNGNFVSDTVGSLAANSASLEALETSFHQDLNGDGTIGLPGTIESFGSTSLVQTGGDYFLDANGTASGPELQYQGSPVTTFSGWSPIAGEQTATGYEVAWHNSNGAFTVWNVDGNGNFVSDTVGSLAANSASLEALETSFHQDLNGDGTIGLPGTIESFGSTSLVQTGSDYFLDANGTASGPELQYQGSPVTTFSGWSPIAGEQTATGYEVAWHNSNGAFTVWNVDGNGNFVSDTVGSLAANSTSLEALETSFHQDLNGDGTIGLPGTIESFGSTSLVQTGSDYFLDANGTASGPELQYQGSPVTTFSGWSPIAGEQTATGYEVAWHNSNGAFTVWNVDGNGNFVSDLVGSLAANSTSLEALETSFHQDLNGDGTIGVPSQTTAATGVAPITAPASGNAILSGTAAPDTFLFNAHFGNDTVTGFQPGLDEVEIDHTLFASVADLFTHTADNAAGSAFVSIGADQSITFDSVSKLVLQQHASDFHLV